MVVHILLRVLAVFCALSSKARCGNIHLGILVPMDYGTWKVGRGIIPIIGRAIRKVNNSGILPGYNITYTLRDSKCSSNTATGITADLMYSQPKVNAYIGPGCSAACTSAGLLAHYWKVPMISFSCSSSSLINRKKYSTFARTQPFSRTYSGVTPEALLKIMQHYQWKRAAIVAPYVYKGDTIWEPIASSVRSHFLRNNITVPYYKVPHVRYNEFAQNERKQMLKTAKSQARVIFILAVREQVSSLIMLAKELNMLNGSYAFITLDFYVSDYLLSETANQTNTKITNDEILEAFNGIITLTVKRASKDEVKRTTKWLTDRMTSDPSNPSAVVSGSAVRTAPFLHDAILLYAYALNRTLQAGRNMSSINGKDLFYRMRSNSSLFTGMSGPVMIDRQGNRVPTFVVENVLFNDTQPLMELWYNGTIKEVFKVDTVWPGGGITRPDDNPECVFIKCLLPGKSKLVRNSIITATVVLAVLFAAVFLFYYRKRKYEQDLLSKTWTISYKDITPVDLDVRFASKVIRNHYDTTSKWSRMTENNPPVTSNPHFGRYKDDFVALKRLRKDTLNLTRDMLVEMKQVRDIVHVNLTQYIGVCLDPSNICIVSQYCHRGSLQEILANDDVKLDWFFRASFANDICMGMKALHASPIIVHGNLRSSKCLIDNRWVCKIADYGLKHMKSNQKKDHETGNHASFAKLFWKAPELLDGITKGSKPLATQAGDAYSFGIILYELLTREEPYSAVDLSPRDVIARVCSRSFPPFRPSIPQDITHIPVINLMKLCWDDNPQVRPSFNEISKRLKEMHKGKYSIVDNMLRLMENYTDQLETIVEERTRQLAEEKTKTDELLYKMLPKSIAESLKNGQPVLAESYQSVTIFFSDIVGFTALAAASTPLQVVHFLNDLYIAFDTIIDSHNVYKVETIGDAYMVVSGLHVPNDNKHAEEIANMALNLLECSKNFKIRHFKSRKLQIRIGMHTGPCVAGVVGIKMPRYCLFGDTVNYASRMESSGVANRIHVSTECKKALDFIGGWQFEERGFIELKGKGTVFTYFLNGKGLGEQDNHEK